MNINTVKHHYSKISYLGILICILGTLFYYYEYYLRVAPGVIREQLKLFYSLNETSFGLLVGLYYWAYVPLQLFVGIVMDLVGPRKTLGTACLISAVGMYLFGGTDYLWAAQLGRFLVGFGAAFAYVGVLKLSNIWLPHTWFAIMAGACSTLGMLGGITGQIVINAAVKMIGWRQVIYVSSMIGVVFSLILWLIIRDHNPDQELAVDLIELKFKRRLHILYKDLKKVIKLPDLWLSGLIGSLTFAGLSVFADVWALSFFKLIDLDHHQLGISSSMIYIGFGVGAPLWGILSEVLQNRKKLLFIGTIIASILITLILYTKLNFIWLNIILFTFGFFLGVEILVFAVVNDVCPKEISATAVGFVNMLIMLSGCYFQPKIGWILDLLAGSSDLSKFRIALSILPLGLIIASGSSTLLKDLKAGS